MQEQPHCTDFLRYLRFEKRYSPHTLENYGRDLEQLCAYLEATFGIGDISHLTHFQLRSWLAGLKDQGLEARTLNRKLSSVNSLFKYLMRTGKADQNPARKLHAQKLPERLPVYLKEAETELLLGDLSFGEGFTGFTDRLICELLYQTGMRRAELLGLKEQDVEWALQQLRVLGKGNKERLIPVYPELLDSLKRYIGEKEALPEADRQYLLVRENGQPLYANYVYRVVTRYLGLVSTLKKRSPHVLRHTFATHLLSNGANIQAIKELLGHSSLAATQIYTHNNIERLKELHRLHHPRG